MPSHLVCSKRLSPVSKCGVGLMMMMVTLLFFVEPPIITLATHFCESKSSQVKSIDAESFGLQQEAESGDFTPGYKDDGGAGVEKDAAQECGYFDVQQVQHTSQALLVTLATACVEKASGDFFSDGQTILPEVKQELHDYLQKQCDTYTDIAVSPRVGQGSTLNKVLDDILYGFVRTKRTLFTRVSSKLMYNEKKQERIDDYAQELDRQDVWMVGQREELAKALLKRVDGTGICHCEMKFYTVDDLSNHKMVCGFRPVTCGNPGCGDVFSASHADGHDLECSFKLLSCKQKCNVVVARGHMNKHCATVCPMKLVNCPFQQVGCTTPMPQGLLEKHCTEYLGQHLLQILDKTQNHEGAIAAQAQQIGLLEKAMSVAQRSEAVDIGSLLLSMKERESHIKSLELEVKKLRQDLKAADCKAEILQIRKELHNMQQKGNTAP